MSHDHAWNPAWGFHGRYTCACGATGYRPPGGGPIRAHKRRTDLSPREPELYIGKTVRGCARRGRNGAGSC